MALADDIAGALVEEFETAKRAGEYDAELDAFMENTVVPAWQSNTPVDSGDLRDSIKVTQRASEGRGEVSATDDAASFVEYGTEHMAEQAPMRRTVEQLQQ